MEERKLNRKTVRYAPWINQVVLGGAIWTHPTLRSFKIRLDEHGNQLPEPKDWWILSFVLQSWRSVNEQHRKLSILVDLHVAAEYWHSKLRQGDPIALCGELRTSKKPDGTYITKLWADTVQLLYPPPDKDVAKHYAARYIDDDV